MCSWAHHAGWCVSRIARCLLLCGCKKYACFSYPRHLPGVVVLVTPGRVMPVVSVCVRMRCSGLVPVNAFAGFQFLALAFAQQNIEGAAPAMHLLGAVAGQEVGPLLQPVTDIALEQGLGR